MKTLALITALLLIQASLVSVKVQAAEQNTHCNLFIKDRPTPSGRFESAEVNSEKKEFALLTSGLKSRGYTLVNEKSKASVLLVDYTMYCAAGSGSPTGGSCELARASISLKDVNSNEIGVFWGEDSGSFFSASIKSAMADAISQIDRCH